MQVDDPYFQSLMLDVKNMRVKHVRKMFVLLREIGAELQLSEMKDRTDWASFHEFNECLKMVVVEHGLTLGEFATGYVLNIQTRTRDPMTEPGALVDPVALAGQAAPETQAPTPPTQEPSKPSTQTKKRKSSGATTCDTTSDTKQSKRSRRSNKKI